ncbi:MAG: hypothetical protein L0Y43_09580 [Methylococcaceae bacterium]|nr:hypothetical protein [Methylococcaceae bacterium]
MVCAKLGIALIHARPYRPRGKGKIERWFKTVRTQLITRLSPQDTASLEALNRKHFALTQFPFDFELEPDALFASTTLAEARARLNHLLELRAIGLVTGEAGSGKTTVCRKITAAPHPGLYRVFHVPLSTGNVRQTCTSLPRPGTRIAD